MLITRTFSCFGVVRILVILAGFLFMGRTPIGYAAPVAGSWCDSTDAGKLDVVVTEEDGRLYMTNTAKYAPADRGCYYFVNWNLLGRAMAGQPIRHVEVEANSLYLVHLYEMSRPKNLTDFWSEDAGKAASAAFVWVGGVAKPATGRALPAGAVALAEIRESPAWFHYEKEDRLPIFSRRFPAFHLPAGKVLSIAIPRVEDSFDDCLRRGVTHFQSGGGDSGELPARERLITLPTGYLNQGIGEAPSNVPHISPTENTYMRSPLEHSKKQARIAAGYDYVFLDEEFWHNDYQPGTLARLCVFAQEARRINPSVKVADFWNPPPYNFSFLGHDRWTAEGLCNQAATHYGDATAALTSANPTMVRKVEVNGQQTCLAEELTAVSISAYFDNLFGFIEQYGTFSNNLFIPAAIHNTRINRQLACNKGKPLIWFGMEVLEGKYNHPRIAYPTRTTNPPGTAIFRDRLPVSPNFNEAVGLFGLLEGDGAYLWEPHGRSDGDANGIFSTLLYCQQAHDDRGEWRPDVKGTPIGKGKTWYPTYHYTASDFYALGAWKYAQIADIVAKGKRVDFEYSTDAGKSWYVPPANGATMVDVARQKRPIVTGAVAGDEIAVVAFNPFQGVADTTSLLVRYERRVVWVELFGTRARVYRGTLGAKL